MSRKGARKTPRAERGCSEIDFALQSKTPENRFRAERAGGILALPSGQLCVFAPLRDSLFQKGLASRKGAKAQRKSEQATLEKPRGRRSRRTPTVLLEQLFPIQIPTPNFKIASESPECGARKKHRAESPECGARKTPRAESPECYSPGWSEAEARVSQPHPESRPVRPPQIIQLAWRSACVIAAALLAGCHPAQQDQNVETDPGHYLYTARCAVCHGTNREGIAPLYPPLAGSPWVDGPPGKLAAVIMDGMVDESGTYHGTMPAWRAVMSDADMATLMTWLRQQDGKGPVTPIEVNHFRVKTEVRGAPWTAEDLKNLKLN